MAWQTDEGYSLGCDPRIVFLFGGVEVHPTVPSLIV